MKSHLYLFLFLGSCFNATAQTLYLTLNPLNCLNCSIGLYALEKDPFIPEIRVVVPQQYSRDPAFLEETFEFSRFDKIKLSYSDSLYTWLSQGNMASEVIVFNKDNRESYREPLQTLSPTVVNRFFRTAAPAPEEQPVCIEGLPRWDGYPQQRYILLDRMTGYFVYDRKNNTSHKIRMDPALQEPLYKAYFKDSFKYKYKAIQQILSELPPFKPLVSHVQRWDSTSLLVQVDIMNFRINPLDPEDTMVFRNPVFLKYLPERQKVTEIYTTAHPISDLFYFWYIYIDRGQYYAQGLHTGTDPSKMINQFAFFSLKLDEKNKSFGLGKLLPVHQPVSYQPRKITSLTSKNIAFGQGMFAFWDHDTLIEAATMKRRKIPIPHQSLLNLPPAYYRMADFMADEQYIYVLYHTQEKNIWSVRFTRDYREVKTVEIDKTNKQGLFGYLDSGNLLLYQSGKEKCLNVERVNYE